MKINAEHHCLLSAIFLGFLLSFLGNVAFADDQVVTLTLSRGPVSCATGTFTTIEQSYILTEAAEPSTATAVVVLFSGGSGKLKIADKQLGINSNNFLVRSRHLFAAQSFHVVVMDAATDFLTCPGGLKNRRVTNAYLSDIKTVIDNLHARYPGLPVWVVGTSRGSTAAAQAGASITLSGVVLTSALTVSTTTSVFDVSLANITAPTLVVVHTHDGCSVTPPADADNIKKALVNAEKTKLIKVVGGFPSLDSNPCQPLTHHGFIGLEPRVVEKITKWIIKSN